MISFILDKTRTLLIISISDAIFHKKYSDLLHFHVIVSNESSLLTFDLHSMRFCGDCFNQALDNVGLLTFQAVNLRELL